MSSPDVLVTVVVGAVLAGALRAMFVEPHRQTQARLARLERSVDRLLAHFGLEETSPLSPQVQDLLRQGKKINAIKAYRDETGVGIKDAKDAMEQFPL